MDVRPDISKSTPFIYLGSENRDPATKWIKSYLLLCFGTFKMPILMFISIFVFRPEGQI